SVTSQPTSTGCGGKLTSEGRTEVGEFLQLNGVATEGAGCSPNGLVGRSSIGVALSCQSGVWKGSSSGESILGGYQTFNNDWTGAYVGCRTINP
ncbi:shufflon system plasmid conjugative transfer pilus tip adhesin PilV, partial [Pseudomonas aeruginosa]|uniref:shufflon system plasmid conjugative transfer pilus tip adhesin PilV n=1 Tax=Pseudomonas aeruginosa TaxID=287 RepID=UPI0031B6B44B